MRHNVPERPLEPTDRQPVGVCAACGEYIYEDEPRRRDECHLIHDDELCLSEWMKTNWPIRELCDAIGVEMEVA